MSKWYDYADCIITDALRQANEDDLTHYICTALRVAVENGWMQEQDAQMLGNEIGAKIHGLE